MPAASSGPTLGRPHDSARRETVHGRMLSPLHHEELWRGARGARRQCTGVTADEQ